MSEKVVFVLCPHNGDNQSWHKLSEKELEIWKSDGSLSAGDMIVYPKKIQKIELQEKLVTKTTTIEDD